MKITYAVQCLQVSALAFDGKTDILVSAQTGSPSVIRVWKYQTRKCAAMFRTEIHNVHCVRSVAYPTSLRQMSKRFVLFPWVKCQTGNSLEGNC